MEVRTTGRLMVAEFGTMLGACLSGVGIVRVKAIGVAPLLREGALVELLPDWQGETFPLYALTPSRHLPPAKVRASIDFCGRNLDSSTSIATSIGSSIVDGSLVPAIAEARDGKITSAADDVQTLIAKGARS